MTKEQIINLFKCGEMSYIDAIIKLEEIGCTSREAEQIIEKLMKE